MRQGPYTTTAKTTKTNSTAAGQETRSSSTCSCGGRASATGTCDCCKLQCFERPRYFCGQLLSDAELNLQQTYFREKSKLYHRTMDGCGVVCGLRMYRDTRCNGHIKIADGYAIDACGNDLVVCDERTFDVIAELRRKKWLVEIPGDDSRAVASAGAASRVAAKADDNCIHQQCFYIGICYSEEPSDFSTPYTTECNAAPGPCEASRIREGARFEIYETLPVRPNPLDSIGKRIEQCFRMFREGQFSKSLASNSSRILDVVCGQTQDSGQDQSQQRDARSLFKELQAQFLHELRTCPDLYNCDLDSEVYRLRAPGADNKEAEASPLECFTKLLQLIQKYVFSSVLAQLTFSCPEPPQNPCVLIGSLEVTNGSLTRVMNYPRWYLWCFGNFFEVLLYTMANDAAQAKARPAPFMEGGSPVTKQQPPEKSDNGCGPEFEIDVCQFLNLFSADHQAFQKAARASVDALQASYRALVAGFDFTKPGGIAPGVLRNLDRTTAERLTDMLGIQFEPSTGQTTGRPDLFAALVDNALRFRSDTLVYDTDDSSDAPGNTVTQVSGVISAPAFSIGPYTPSMLTDIMERLTSAESRIRQCETRLGAGKQEPSSPPKNPSGNPPAGSQTPPSNPSSSAPGAPPKGSGK